MSTANFPQQPDTGTPEPQTAPGVPPVPPEGSPQADGVAEGSREARRLPRGGDVREQITGRIIAMLEQGGQVFQARWRRAAQRGMPTNGLTGRRYHGANVLLLWDAAMVEGYRANVWLTYRQAQGLGGQVRRGEHGVMCAHFEPPGPRGRRGKQGGEDAPAPAGGEAPPEPEAGGRAVQGGLLCRAFWLFNVAQIDGLPDALACQATQPAPAEDPKRNRALKLLMGCDPTLRYGYTQAMYVTDLDQIRLPLVRAFTGYDAYLATSLHELVHWTGHPDRLNRQFGRRFGDDAYAFEELVAELGSAFLLGDAGLVDATIEGHAGYLAHWLRVLKNDRTAIFTAARLAGQAYDYIASRALD